MIRPTEVEPRDGEGRSSFSGLMCIFFAKCLPSQKDRPLATPTTEERHDESREGLDR